jgi:two-component system cell cycle sensor histidine kinase/response regulator CckA
MSNIQKELTEKKDPEDNPDPVSEESQAADPGRTFASPGNPEQVQLAKLQEVERRFQTVFEAAPIGIAIANPQGYFVEVNDAFVNMLGYSRQEIGNITFVDLTHPDDRAETQRLSQEVRDGKINFYRTEKRYRKKNGAAVWTVVRATAIRNDDDSIKYWLGLMVDITEHKKAKEDLAESEEKYRKLFESSAEGILVAQIEDHKFKYANHTICDMLGYGSDELTRMGVEDIHPEEDLPFVLDEFRALARGEKGLAENIPCLHKDGTKIFVNINSTIMEIDGVECNVGLFQNISERLKSEEALRQSEEKYRSILESIEEGYFEVDLSGNFTFFNDAMAKITGFPPQELKGTNNRYFTSQETAKKMFKVFNRVYRTGRSARVLNYEIITKDGSKKVLEVSASLMRNTDQKPIGFRGLVRDVTEHLSAEKEKERMAAQIRQAQKMEAIGTLAGGIAHDFNNLLMGFQGNLSLMLMEINPDNPYYDYLTNMEDYVKRGSDLTRQILGFARGGKYEVRTTNINDLLEQSSQMFGRTRKEILIHKKFQATPWPVEVDRGQIEQVLLNLFVNAWQAMPTGGDIFLETENVTLKEEGWDKPYALKQGQYVKVAVGDTGVGMDKDTLERIFEPFYTTKEVSRGTGLGLASAYGIIKNHNGMIEVTSEKGNGTTVTIYLPKSAKDFVEEKPAIEQAIKGRETILLVDDEEMVADVGAKMLQKLGYRVMLAESGRKAIQKFEKLHSRIDLVILDMIMPEMGGSETFDQLKAIAPDIKVLLSSGYSLDGQASQIMKRGCNGFIQKPFNLKHFSQKVRKILDE